MPFNGSGSFSPPGADFPYVPATLIESTKVNNVISDIATGLSTCITKDGQTTITANIPMGGFRLTGLGAGSAAGQSLRYEQVFTTGLVTLLGTITAPTTIGVGAVTPAASGSGISFPASQSASTDANTLDDYEEGTFTPTLTFGGAATGLTYTSQVGIYTKVGNVVHAFVRIAVNDNGSSTGAAVVTMTGLPVIRNTTGYVPVAAAVFDAMSGGTATAPVAIGQTNTNTVSLNRFVTGSITAIDETSVINGAIILFSLTYHV